MATSMQFEGTVIPCQYQRVQQYNELAVFEHLANVTPKDSTQLRTPTPCAYPHVLVMPRRERRQQLKLKPSTAIRQLFIQKPSKAVHASMIGQQFNTKTK